MASVPFGKLECNPVTLHRCMHSRDEKQDKDDGLTRARKKSIMPRPGQASSSVAFAQPDVAGLHHPRGQALGNLSDFLYSCISV